MLCLHACIHGCHTDAEQASEHVSLQPTSTLQSFNIDISLHCKNVEIQAASGKKHSVPRSVYTLVPRWLDGEYSLMPVR